MQSDVVLLYPPLKAFEQVGPPDGEIADEHAERVSAPLLLSNIQNYLSSESTLVEIMLAHKSTKEYTLCAIL